MGNKLEFNGEDTNTILLHLLVENLAFQQASVAVIMEHLHLNELEKDEIVKQIKAELPAIKERIIETAYESFGKTPNI